MIIYIYTYLIYRHHMTSHPRVADCEDEMSKIRVGSQVLWVFGFGNPGTMKP